ncbi:MAG: 2,3-bisphosphoglycerate-independent phosphoglycerate mutase [bacterium]
MTNPIRPKPIVLVILDGWGISPAWGGNILSVANVRNYNKLWRENPHTILEAAGEAVGLPKHDVGNSEVGHIHIGAGRLIPQDLSQINNAITDGSLKKNKTILTAIQHVKKNNSQLHLMGLVSDGGIHSHINHLFHILEICKEQNCTNVFIHVFTDGRDSDPMSALKYIQNLENFMHKLGFGQIATVCGRYYAMDRDNRWDRTSRAYFALTQSIGEKADSAMNAVSKSYSQGTSDEFIKPTIIQKNNKPTSFISSNDSIIFFNFRADRARQLTKAFTQENFISFHKGRQIPDLFFVSMLPYESEYKGKVQPVFQDEEVPNCLAEIISNADLSQLHIAETEKYAHVTYFINGAREKPFPREKRILIPSPKVATYDLAPEMSAGEITKKTLESINKYDFIVINFANPDMVGHTGNQEATLQALEFVDKCIEQITNAILKSNGVLILTADHGNAEELIDPVTGNMKTEHTNNPVPFILISDKSTKYHLRKTGRFTLSNIAPTILELLKLEIPTEMTSKSLLDNNIQNNKVENNENQINPAF